MLIDCDNCAVRGAACDGCLVSALVDAPDAGRLTAEERRAIEVLARAGFDVQVLAVPKGIPLRRVRSNHQRDRRRRVA